MRTPNPQYGPAAADISPRRPLGRAFWQLWVPLGVLLFWVFRDAAFSLSLEFFIGVAVAVLSLTPGFVWAYRDTRELPAFPLFCLAHFFYYGYPILVAKPAYMTYPEKARLLAGLNVLVFLCVAQLVYYRPGRRRAETIDKFSGLGLRRMSEEMALRFFTICLFVWFLMLVARSFGWLTPLGGALNIVWSMGNAAGIMSVFFLCRLMGAGSLSLAHRVVALLGLGTGCMVFFASGFLVGGTQFMLVALLGYALGRGRIPWGAALCCLSLVAFLSAGKTDMRRAIWRNHAQGITLSPGKIAEIYAYWLPASWRNIARRHREIERQPGIFDRTNLIHMQALVTHYSPASHPFLMGKTYRQFPILLVPRILWRNKPAGHLSSRTLGLYYGIHTYASVGRTSIGFGPLGEAWANFGWFGIVGLGLFFGLTMRFVARLCYGLSPTAFVSLLSVVWLGWSFQLEGAMSSWLVSLIQSLAMAALAIYPFTYRCRTAPKPWRPGLSRTWGATYAQRTVVKPG